MQTSYSRRRLLQTIGLSPLLAGALLPLTAATPAIPAVDPKFQHRLKLSLNCYSFNTPLRAGQIDLFDLLDFCAANQIDAIDPTGYYFPTYPDVPADEYLYRFKRKAFLLGIDISGSGVRNDFTLTDPEKRKAEIEHVKRWIIASEKLGAPTLRVFAGVTSHPGFTRDQVFEWMAANLCECVEFGQTHGVVVAIQNHNDFLKTADDVLNLFQLVNSDWLGLNLDIGSYRSADPYDEIRRTIHLAVTWQIKEQVYFNGQEQKTDYPRLISLIKESGYRGYLPLETLGAGDPFIKLPRMLNEVRAALGQHEPLPQ